MSPIEPLEQMQARWPTHAQLISEFKVHQKRRHISQETVEKRVWMLRQLAGYIAPKHLLEVTAADINGWLDSRPGQRGHGITASTRGNYITCLSMFFSWCVREEKLLRDPCARVERPELPTGLPRPVQDEVLDNALEAISKDDPRLFAIMTLMYLCGLRCVEVSRLLGENVFHDSIKVDGKGRKERVVPLNDDVRAALRRYGVPANGPVFTHLRGIGAGRFPLSRKTISRYVSLALPAGTTAHQLRHWFGTFFYDTCKDLRLTADAMGHTNINTTVRYTKVDIARAQGVTSQMGLRRRRRINDE